MGCIIEINAHNGHDLNQGSDLINTNQLINVHLLSSILVCTRSRLFSQPAVCL